MCAGEALLLLLALCAAWFGCLQPIWDPDSYWHLSVSREMGRSGQVMRTETFSSECSSVPWVDTNWLAHLPMEPLRARGGYRTLERTVGFLAALAAAFTFWAARAQGASALPFALILTVWLTAFSGRFRFRPEAAALVIFALLVWLLSAQGTRPFPRWGFTLGIPALFLVWVQVHGSWSYGFLLLGVYLVGRLLDATGPGERRLWLFHGALSLGLSVLALLITPYGADLALFPLKHLSGLADPSLVKISEWGRPPWNRTTAPFLFASLALLAWLCARVLRRERAWTDLLWGASQTALVFLWVRYCSFGWIALAPLGCTAIEQIRRRLGSTPQLLAGGLAAFLALQRIAAGIAYDPTEIDLHRNYPVLETAYLQSRDLTGNLFHTFVSGGYLSHELYPQAKIFFDGRYFPFRNQMIEYDRAKASIGTLRTFLGDHRFDIAVLPHSSARTASPGEKPRPAALALFTREDWAPVHFGPYGVVFLKRIPRYAHAISRDEFKAYFPGDEPNLIAAIRGGHLGSEALLPEVDRAIRTGLPLFGPTRPLAFRRALSEGAFLRDIPLRDPGEK